MYLCITKQTKMSKYYKDNKLYTPTPQELIEWDEIMLSATNDNSNKVEVDDKDVNLRLECLKLAIELNKRNVGLDMAYCLEEAIESYNWIKTNQ
jgi:hypothetical protein